MMFRCAIFVLFLTIGVADLATTTDAPSPQVSTTQALTTHATKATTAAPATKATTAAPATNATTAAPATKATTAAPATKATTAAPVTEATTVAPAPNATTVAPATNATTVAPATNATTLAPATNATTAAPATNATTAAPATNATTAAPATNATTASPLPPTTPTPPLPKPTTGKYNVTGQNGTCLMANFGLRITLADGEKSQDMNLDPSGTAASGACGAESSDLVLASDKITLMFTFTTEAKKFQLHSLNVTGKSSSGKTFVEANTNLSLWQAALGSSYMCNKQQIYNITKSLTLHTFELRVQPFEITKGDFSTAHECSMDDTSILIPIIVGAALAGLILIVVIAYAIGRRKTYVGYQTL